MSSIDGSSEDISSTCADLAPTPAKGCERLNQCGNDLEGPASGRRLERKSPDPRSCSFHPLPLLHRERAILPRTEGKAAKGVKLVGVLPEPVAEAEAYLNREGVHLDQVKQVQLESIGVSGTPTMLLLNEDGVVTQTWVGKLTPEEGDKALKAILGAQSASLSDKLVASRDTGR